MRFFTYAWHTGALTDTEFDACIPAYHAHLHQIAAQLTPSLRTFIQAINLHDGLIHQVCVDYAQHSLVVTIRCGDLQQGYHDLIVSYRDVALEQLDRPILALAASNPSMEILSDEVDVMRDGRFCHSLLFAPSPEITVIFGDLSYHVEQRADRLLPDITTPYLEIG